MNARVNPLTAMQIHSDMLEALGMPRLSAEIADALTQVIELATAAELMADLMPDAELETDSVQGEIVARLRAALAPFTEPTE